MEITFEGKSVFMTEPAFGKVKKIVSVYNRMNLAISQSSSPMDDDVIAGMSELLALALDKSPEQLDEMKISFSEMMAAVPCIAELCGISFKRHEDGAPGERPGVGGTNSTSTS